MDAPTADTDPTGAHGTDPARTLAALSAALFDHNDDLVWDFEPSGRVRRVNARVGALLGREPADVVGRGLAELVVDDGDRAAVAAAFANARAGRSGSYTFRMPHRDGGAVTLQATVIPLAVDGEVRRVYAGCRDVTAEAAAVAALAEREALYGLLVEQSPECVAVFQDGRYAYVNPAGARLLGRAPAAVAARGWAEFTHADDRAAVDALFAGILAAPGGTSRAYETRLVAADGGVVVVEGTATAVTYRGRPAVHSFMRDVTSRRRAETERVRAQRMEALGRLAASVAHDVNNLLAVMLGAVELAGDAAPAGDPLRDDLAAAAAAAHRGRALTRQLLTFARREPSAPRPTDVNQLVRGMQELLRRAAGPEVRLDLALADDAGVTAVDPAQAEQALLNLVINAREAMAGGGRVTIETARAGRDLRVTVRDTGPGVAAEARPHLFEPFFTTKAEGTGLGLATVYGVVTGAGGRVEVEGEPGRGAAFHLYFPQAGAPPAGGAAADAPVDLAGGARAGGAADARGRGITRGEPGARDRAGRDRAGRDDDAPGEASRGEAARGEAAP